MIDETIWEKLTEDEKLNELESYLTSLRELEAGKSEYYNTPLEGKIKTLKTEIKNKIKKIIELEHVL
jgi:hypothetical protein